MKQMLKACSFFALAVALSYAAWSRLHQDNPHAGILSTHAQEIVVQEPVAIK